MAAMLLAQEHDGSRSCLCESCVELPGERAGRGLDVVD